MAHLTYLLLLAGCLVVTAPLEWLLGVRVYRQTRRLIATLVPIAVLFCLWDVAEIAAGAWSYERRYLIGVDLPGRLPVEELLFFLVVPVCSILTLEAVARFRPSWR